MKTFGSILCDFYPSGKRNTHELTHNHQQEFRILMRDAAPQSIDPKNPIARFHLLLCSGRRISQMPKIKKKVKRFISSLLPQVLNP